MSLKCLLSAALASAICQSTELRPQCRSIRLQQDRHSGSCLQHLRQNDVTNLPYEAEHAHISSGAEKHTQQYKGMQPSCCGVLTWLDRFLLADGPAGWLQ